MFCKSGNKGFTLIEILVAIVLFAIGALAAARMQTTGIRGTTFGKEALVATTAAQNLMEQLKELPVLNTANFAGVVLPGGGPAPVKPDNSPASVKAETGQSSATSTPVQGMTVQWGVSNTTGVAPSRYTTVTVTIRWAGNTRSYVARTIISESQ